MQDLWTHLMGGFATAASGANLMWAFVEPPYIAPRR